MDVAGFVRSLPTIPFLVAVAFPLAMAGVAIYAALHAWKRARAIGGMPTSPIHTATDGYVELAGHVAPPGNRTLVAPLTRAACVWFHAKVEEWIPRRGTKQRSVWRTVEETVSEEPFLLRDGSGVCAVFPRGAEVTGTDWSLWYGPTREPADRSPRRFGPGESPEGMLRIEGTAAKRFRFTEERIYAGDPLFALGRFSTEAWPDDDEEATGLTAAARAATTKRLLATGSRAQPFLLSTTPQAKLEEMLALGWKAALGVAVVPLGIAGLLVWLRFA